jgi:hypothetical protein
MRRKQRLRVETPEGWRAGINNILVDLKGRYVSTDHGDLGSCVEGGEKEERRRIDRSH